MKNYYDILQVRTTATQTEIKKAYLKKIKQFHPDAYKGDKFFAEQKTAEITQAYTTLKDETLRKKYDAMNDSLKPTTKKKTEQEKSATKNVQKQSKKDDKKTTKTKEVKVKKIKNYKNNIDLEKTILNVLIFGFIALIIVLVIYLVF